MPKTHSIIEHILPFLMNLLDHGAKTDGECKVFDFAKKFSHGHILCSEKKENSKKCRKDKKLVE